ncbi:hypothetical protein EDD11_001995 [Mortierella claussenii]|nr:hypothetical protein EDD11_001995 [Mortierella claussenii]
MSAHTNVPNPSASSTGTNTPSASPTLSFELELNPNNNPLAQHSGRRRPLPRLALVPSEAALLQSLLLENNIMPEATIRSTILGNSAGQSSNSGNAINASSNINTIDRDFRLFEPDESSFDYPLFVAASENGKLNLLRQQNAAMQHLSAVQQQPLQQSQSVPQQQQQHHHHPQQQCQALSANPLCTPQTPSLELMESYSRSTETLGFDNLSVFLDEPSAGGMDGVPHRQHQNAATAVALIHVSNLMNLHAPDGLLSPQYQHQSPHGLQSATSVMADSPLPSYLDTPFETPYLTDFEVDCSNNDCANAISRQILPFDASSHEYGDRSGGSQYGHGAFSLFPEYDLADLPTSGSLEGCAPFAAGGNNNNSTIEPTTLLMVSSSLDLHHKQGDIPSSQASSSSSSSSSSDDFIRDISDAISCSYSPHTEDLTILNGLADRGYDDMMEKEDVEENEKEDVYSSSSSESEDDDDDEDDDYGDEFIPSRKLAMAAGGSAPMSGFKRKALASFKYDRGSNENGSSSMDCDLGYEASTASVFKRTRPALASPYGGKTNFNNQFKGTRTSNDKKPNKKRPSGAAAKRFSCIHPGCDRQFARLFNLHTHERTHDPDQIRPFICGVVQCSKGFSRKHDLQRHEASVHMGERNYRCPICSKPFSRQDGLRRHLSVKGNIICAEAAAKTMATFDDFELGPYIRLQQQRWLDTGETDEQRQQQQVQQLREEQVRQQLVDDTRVWLDGIDLSSLENPDFPWNPGIYSIICHEKEELLHLSTTTDKIISGEEWQWSSRQTEYSVLRLRLGAARQGGTALTLEWWDRWMDRV